MPLPILNMGLKTVLLAWMLATLLYCPVHARGSLLPQGQGAVAHNFDGDTLKLTDRRVVRLAGIDTPELGCKKDPPQYHARASRDLLNNLAKGKKIHLYGTGEESKDRYGRITAEVLLDDGRSLNEIMVREGAAFVYPHKGQDPELLERLLSLQRQAIQQRKGMWEHLLSLPVAHQTYLGNRNSQRFFPADCTEAQRIKPRNRVYFGTLMDAFLLGYAPARVCPFWPTEK